MSLSVSEIKKPVFITVLAVFAATAFPTLPQLHAQENSSAIDDITAKYHFISKDDTLAILDEEGRLKGFIEVTQPADESEDVLTYDITEGVREKDQVKFRTSKIHGKYFRFSGTVERGKGREDKDPDYFHMTGTLETVAVDAETGKESIQAMTLTFRSIGKNERPDD